MKRNIHVATGDTKLEVVNSVEGKNVLTIRLSNKEFELNRSLSEGQLKTLIAALQSHYQQLQDDKDKIAAVSYYGINGCSNTKNYHFLTNIKNLKVGDYVVVDSAGDNSIGKFVGYLEYATVNPTKRIIRKAKPVTTYI